MIAIAYMKNYSTSCRGCTMERYDSDFKLHHFVTEDEAIEWFADLSGTTRFDQEQGNDAWDFYIIKDGFEEQMQILQCFDHQTDGEWKSQDEVSSFFDVSEMKNIIDTKAEIIYNNLVEYHRDKNRREEQEKEQQQLALRIANAKKLIEQHPDSFKEVV